MLWPGWVRQLAGLSRPRTRYGWQLLEQEAIGEATGQGGPDRQKALTRRSRCACSNCESMGCCLPANKGEDRDSPRDFGLCAQGVRVNIWGRAMALGMFCFFLVVRYVLLMQKVGNIERHCPQAEALWLMWTKKSRGQCGLDTIRLSICSIFYIPEKKRNSIGGAPGKVGQPVPASAWFPACP